MKTTIKTTENSSVTQLILKILIEKLPTHHVWAQRS
jgi:hypothetical protein